MHMQEVARSRAEQADEDSADEQGADQRNDHVDKILKAQAAEAAGNDGERTASIRKPLAWALTVAFSGRKPRTGRR